MPRGFRGSPAGLAVAGELSKSLTAGSFEIKAEIRFIPNDQAARPKIKTDRKGTGTDGLDDVIAAAADATGARVVREGEDEERSERRQSSSGKIRKVAWSFLKKNDGEDDDD